MKLKAYSDKFDWLLQLLVLPIYVSLLNWILIGDSYWQRGQTFGLATVITLADAFLNWYINNSIAFKINYLHPDPKEFVPRAFRRFFACTISSGLNVSLIFLVFWAINMPGFAPVGVRLGLGLLFTTIIVAIVVIIYESIDSFNYWQQSRQEVDTLSKAQLQAQLDTLRQQVNPHFLFNSLNSLISLIGEDPRQAETFAEELSSVYRYLLRSNESSLIPLASELEFIQSYYHLLKTRHGDALRMHTCILPGTETKQIPPLTLQLLIENAVKHNIVLPEQPLTIVLSTTEQQLIVTNNLQRKSSRILSTGVGLSNIMSKYQMLGQPTPIIQDDGNEFRVILPLG